ncbi:MAG: cation transporter [Chitinophagaceae bacterium]|nr:cation transporter [Chitinophagaceae bacterium]
MTCEACREQVNYELAKLNGVIEFQTSYGKASSRVKFDKSKTSTDSIAAAINRIGYKVISQIVTINK